MSLASVDVEKAVRDQSTVQARRAMRLGVRKRMKKVWRELVGCGQGMRVVVGCRHGLSLEEGGDRDVRRKKDPLTQRACLI